MTELLCSDSDGCGDFEGAAPRGMLLMNCWHYYFRGVTAFLAGACSKGACADRRRALLWALVALLALQTAAVPAAGLASWLPAAQRESEGESTSPEESSKETISSTPVFAASARARRAQAHRLARLENIPQLGCHRRNAADFSPGRPSELTGRNGRGCTLRC